MLTDPVASASRASDITSDLCLLKSPFLSERLMSSLLGWQVGYLLRPNNDENARVYTRVMSHDWTTSREREIGRPCHPTTDFSAGTSRRLNRYLEVTNSFQYCHARSPVVRRTTFGGSTYVTAPRNARACC